MSSASTGMKAAATRLRRARQLLAASAALALLLPMACGQRRTTPMQPEPVALSPEVTAVSPPPRSTFVPYDSLHIWAEFAAPLDSTSVSTLTVFLKIDTRRLAVAVTWDGAHRRIVLTPLSAVELQQTYTVVLAPDLRSASGVSLGTTWSWQFTVNSVRRPSAPQPPIGTVGESPFVSLAWTGNGSTDGAAVYEVFAGRDSAAVAARSVPIVYAGALTRILPPTRWPQDGPVYWAVNTVGQATRERLRGPVWRFTTVPASTPVDSLQVPLDYSAYSYYESQGWAATICKGSNIIVGPGYNAGIVWDLSGVPRTVRLADARMTLSAMAGYESALSASTTSIWYATTRWDCIRTRPNGPPWTDEVNGRLATRQLDAPGRARFESDTLTAHLEACVRLSGYYGYVLRSNRVVYLASQTDPFLRPTLTLYYYRPPAAALSGTTSTLGARR